MSDEKAIEQGEAEGEPESLLLLRDEDDRRYAIPQSVLERFRLSEEGQRELETALAGDEDVQGFQYIGQFRMTKPYNLMAGTGWAASYLAFEWKPETSYYPQVN